MGLRVLAARNSAIPEAPVEADKQPPRWFRKRTAGQLRTIAALEANLRKSLGREPLPEEVASMLAMTPGKLAKLRGG